MIRVRIMRIRVRMMLIRVRIIAGKGTHNCW